MNIIGIRSTPKIIYYSIIQLNDGNFNFINQCLQVPVSFDVPQQLKYIRKTMLDIFNEYQIKCAGIRVTENVVTPDKFRLMLEGIIQELIASSTVESYFVGVKASIGKRLSIENDGTISDIMDGKMLFKEIEDWNGIRKEYRECIMVAFAANEPK